MGNTLQRLEEELDQLVRQGRAAPLAGDVALSVSIASWNACATTRATFWRPTNVDNVFLGSTRVGGEDALVLSVAHGNYKDEGCAYASAAAVVAIATELDGPLLSDADISPALQRAILGANDRIREISRAPLPASSRFRTAFSDRPRSDLRSIGASVLVVLATSTHAWLAHVGENHAILQSPLGAPKMLVLPHTLGNDPTFRAQARLDPEIMALHGDVPIQVLGLGATPRMDVSRVPVAQGDVLLVGNASLGLLDPVYATAPATTASRIADAMAEKHSYAPATIIVAIRT